MLDDPSASSAGGPSRSRLQTRIGRVVASRRIFPFLALMTMLLAALAGFIVTLVDEEDFPSLGVGGHHPESLNTTGDSVASTSPSSVARAMASLRLDASSFR